MIVIDQSYSLPVCVFALFLSSQSHSHVGVGGVEVIYDIRYSLGEQESPDRLNNHHPLTQCCV